MFELLYYDNGEFKGIKYSEAKIKAWKKGIIIFALVSLAVMALLTYLWLAKGVAEYLVLVLLAIFIPSLAVFSAECGGMKRIRLEVEGDRISLINGKKTVEIFFDSITSYGLINGIGSVSVKEGIVDSIFDNRLDLHENYTTMFFTVRDDIKYRKIGFRSHISSNISSIKSHTVFFSEKSGSPVFARFAEAVRERCPSAEFAQVNYKDI